jgi:hypothetical protein
LGEGSEIATPIVLGDREGWLVVVDGPGEVAAAIEANDVEAGEYVGLDADGRVLALSVRYASDRPAWRSAQEIKVSASSDRVGRDDLRALLAEALGDHDQRASVSDLLRDARQRQRFDLQAPQTSALLRRRVGSG